MFSFKFISLAAFCLFCLSSCLTLVEQVDLKRDGSGVYTSTVDMSELKSLIQMGGDSLADATVERLNGANDTIILGLKGLSGLSGFSVVSDVEKFEFGYKFSFKDISSLNAAISQVTTNQKKTGGSMMGMMDGVELNPSRFELKGRKFTKVDQNDYSKIIGNSMNDEMKSMMEMFKDVKMVTRINFEKKVASVSEKDQIEISNNSVTSSYYLLDNEKNGKRKNGGFTVKIK
jgi:hypothetical protein